MEKDKQFLIWLAVVFCIGLALGFMHGCAQTRVASPGTISICEVASPSTTFVTAPRYDLEPTVEPSATPTPTLVHITLQ